jgi:hypothetical protein
MKKFKNFKDKRVLNFLFSIALRQDKESDRMRKSLQEDCSIMLSARRTAHDSAENIEAWSGSVLTRTVPLVTAAEDTAIPFFRTVCEDLLVTWVL